MNEDNYEPTEADLTEAKKLIDDGYYSTSNKHRSINRVPSGKTAIEALREIDPDEALRIEKQWEAHARSQLLRIYVREHALDLSPVMYRAFKRAGGPSA